MDAAVSHYFHEGHNYSIIVALLDRHHRIQTSVRTVKRVLQRLGLKRNGVLVSHVDFSSAVISIQSATDQRAGYRRVWHLLRRRLHIRVTQERTRLFLRQLNPQAVINRTYGVLIRRRYVSAGPNHVWHCDGYDKLKPYGVALHGCIDGFSRKIMWLHCSTTNNDPKVILWYYLTTVKTTEGAPAVVRSDCGTETGLVAAAQCTLRNNQRSHIYGPSYRNQRIESWWSVMRKEWAQIWMDLFDDLVSFGFFNPSHPFDAALAQFCFIPIIQMELNMFVDEWNTHRIRRTPTSGCPGGVPTELYDLPERYGFRDQLRPVSLDDVRELMVEASPPPLSSNSEVHTLCQVLIQEQGWQVPVSRQEATELFIRFKHILEN